MNDLKYPDFSFVFYSKCKYMLIFNKETLKSKNVSIVLCPN